MDPVDPTLIVDHFIKLVKCCGRRKTYYNCVWFNENCLVQRKLISRKYFLHLLVIEATKIVGQIKAFMAEIGLCLHFL